ncbi:MAG TPA: exo-alpha-sialidase [Rhodocyclaceae bacterium]|uniref:exo-alpha-sialidase n=1 Tax=Zoogloea sp. TaxID=49181 RepID=UPI002CEF3239|nr:exo-alpha-sialidase [Zoogloea sp.]HMV18911.1 exo-alpha-sialidase [Rhodocyclaceae bacterium]HMY49817.1 exo-alpha-sialidase [Rhodocyclaceae bacterium]HNB63354.1 exo-alpha-sialidase [Rhodocyclaceae bacterium]HNC79318.1 exo-alpha-sialidase [Rhodocyclaceae bacterium]HNH16902.1 exo-alpha-sialidase [Zoogloea sp.]
MKKILPILFPLLAALTLPAAAHEGHDQGPAARPARIELATAAAFGPDGQLHIVAKDGAHLVWRHSPDLGATWSAPQHVNMQAESIAADGDSQPRIAFNRDGELLVTWTKPLPKPYTGEIRLARLPRDGSAFDAPITVHRDQAEITHRFQNLIVAPDGRVTVVWIDKRDQEAARLAQKPWRGAGVYSAISDDGGRSFQPERKLAEHSCECCRIALALDPDGTPVALWRHVFAPNERDHALARLKADGTPEAVQRATFDRWRVDACPHQGPALAIAADGVRHAVWFNQRDGEGRVFYGRPTSAGVNGQRPVGGPAAAHADIAVLGRRVVLLWKEFDGERTRLRAQRSDDDGRHFDPPQELDATAGASDQPRLLTRDGRAYAFWRTADAFRVVPLP